MKQVVIHTDGGCSPNPGPGGWAAILSHDRRQQALAGGDPATTNNRMELQAAISALQALKEPCQVELHTDSQYLRRGITAWIRGWKRNGWLTVERKSVKNSDLWRQLDALTAIHHVRWLWLRGHAGHPLNERCDRLACAEIDKIRRRVHGDQRMHAASGSAAGHGRLSAPSAAAAATAPQPPGGTDRSQPRKPSLLGSWKQLELLEAMSAGPSPEGKTRPESP
jgi:ribonuclease HI